MAANITVTSPVAPSTVDVLTIMAADWLPWLFIAFVAAVACWRFYRATVVKNALRKASKIARDYDVVIVGGSIAGPPLALQLAKQGRRVAVVESSLERPDRIVGELMQPGGLAALRKMGLEHCARSVGVPCTGYCARFDGSWVQLPYEDGIDGVSFHFGDLVMKLRSEMLAWTGSAEAKKTGGSITVIEGTVNELMFESPAKRVVVGVNFKRASDKSAGSATAHLVVLCDGGFTKFRPIKGRLPVHSYFVGIILKNIKMPFETRGHVVLCKNGPVLSYRLDNNDVRILADFNSTSLKNPTNDVLIPWLENEVLPQMPEEYRQPLTDAINHGKVVPNAIRTHPHFKFTPVFPVYRGIVTCGDSGNMRHPLTGGGMTCALRDVISLSEQLSKIPYLGDESRVHDAIFAYLRRRPFQTSVINILSWALHGVFRGPYAMRRACFEYFVLGGECVRTPMAFLSAINGSLMLLMYHYVRVMIYGAFIVLLGGNKQPLKALLSFFNPMNWFVAVHVLFHSACIFLPTLWTEFGAKGHLIDTTVASW